VINWTIESINAENEYRREKLHRLADHHTGRSHRTAPGQDRDPGSWWKRLRSGG
jgi:hypothetical protein